MVLEFPPVDFSKIGKVSIHLLTFNEEAYVKNTLESLRAQRLYQENWGAGNIEIVLVDSYSTDRTVETAALYVDRIIFAPRGKLTARRIAIEQSPNATIIVSVDAGDYYPPNFLNMLLRHFSDPDVVAVSGSEMLTSDTPIIRAIRAIISNTFVKRLQGRAMAMRRDAFFKAGGWDESINQFNLGTIWKEEEFHLFYKMRRIGKVVLDPEVRVYALPRRFYCSLDNKEEMLEKYCEEIREGERF